MLAVIPRLINLDLFLTGEKAMAVLDATWNDACPCLVDATAYCVSSTSVISSSSTLAKCLLPSK